MKNFLQKLTGRMQQWMSGRYGCDELSAALSVVTLVGLVLSCIPRLRILIVPTMFFCIWSLFRCYSKNLEKRRAERESYLRFTGQVRSRLHVRQKAWKERKTHRYFRCKQCHTVLRVPKGKGKVKINCPKCHTELVKKT
jgi:hypothetical protein